MAQVIAKKRGLLLAAALAVAAAPGVAHANNGEAEKERKVRLAQADVSVDDRVNVTQGEGATGTDGRQAVRGGVQAVRDEVRDRVSARKAARLQDAQLKRCKAQEKAITNIMARIGDRGQKHLDLFSDIAGRVQAFYVEKGYAVGNYDELVADVTAKKEAAQAVVDDIKAADTAFDCEGDNPKGVVDGFKASLQEQIAALKEYRTAVKNLIVSVKSAQSAGMTEPADEGGVQ